MSHSVFKFAFIIEGQGETEAIPLLIRRICMDIVGFYAFETTRPVRVSRSKIVRTGELERALRLALGPIQGDGAVLVVLDADDDAPCVFGPNLKSRALRVTQPHRVSIVAPECQFESWFLASAKSLSGVRGLRAGLEPPRGSGEDQRREGMVKPAYDRGPERLSDGGSSSSCRPNGLSGCPILQVFRQALPRDCPASWRLIFGPCRRSQIDRASSIGAVTAIRN